MKKAEVKILQGNEWQLEGDLVLKEGKIYVPKNEELRVEIVCVVATTKPMFNDSISNKSQGRISSREHELCNSQENLIGNHNSILPTIYISVLDPCYDFSIPTLMSMLCPHVLLLIHHVIYMYPDIIPSTLLLISIVHACTICTP